MRHSIPLYKIFFIIFATKLSCVIMKAFISTFFFMCFCIPIFPEIGAHFYQLDINNSFSNKSIITIYKDKLGYLWIATSNELGRYDGSRIKLYNSDYANSIWTNNISEIQEDAWGNLLMKRNNTQYYFVYYRKKDCFSNDLISYLNGIGFKCKTKPQKVLIENQNMWFIYRDGIYCYDFKKKKQNYYPIRNVADIKVNNENAFIIQNDGTIAKISIRNNFVVFDNSFNKICKERQISNLNLFVDLRNGIWVYSKGSGNGIYHCNKNNDWVHFGTSKADNYILRNNQVCAVLDDAKGNIWIALEHSGIDVFSEKENRVMQLERREDGILSNRINCLYLDSDHNIWIGYLKNGLSFSTNQPVLFESYSLPGVSDPEFRNDVTAIMEDKYRNLWIGTDGNGLTVLSKDMKFKSHYDVGISNNVVICIYEDKSGKIWIGTYQNGLYCYNNGKITHIKKGEKGLEDNDIWSITEDSEGSLWIGTLVNGPQRWNANKEYFDKPIKKIWLNNLCSSKSGHLYVASYGFLSIDTKTMVCHQIQTGNKKGNQSLFDKELRYIYYDSRGLLWMGNTTGLSIYDERKDFIYYLNRDNGLQNNVIQSIVEDKEHNIWVSTENNVSKIIVRSNNKRYSFSIQNYSEKDGLKSSRFNTKAVFVNRNGDIYYGGNKGFSILKYGNKNITSKKPTILLTDIQVENDVIKVDSVYNGYKIIDEDLNNCKQIQLNYSDRNITIYFSAPESVTGTTVRYAYRLDSSLPSDWIYTNNAEVTFDHLSPGHYVLKVKACNNNGEWGNETYVEINVLPPFYMSLWAYLLYLILLSIITYYVYYIIKHRQTEKLHLHQIKMELDKQRHIDKMKFEFFTNVSHDFRTPLSLIVTPIEKLLEDYKDKPITKTLQIIHNNAMQLTMLINQLLNFRKLDESGEKVCLSNSDYIAFVKSLCSEFELIQKDKMIKLSCITNLDELKIDFDKDKLNKILMNLLSNAFKFSPKNSEVTVVIKTDSKMVSTSVKDNGIGVPDKDKTLIFNRFYQIDEKHKNYGSGIGLHIVSQYISLINGEISLTDNKPSGCIFTFTFPVSNNLNANDATVETITGQELESRKEERRKLLIVEDNEDFRNFIDECLNVDYQIIKATDGEEALELLSKNNVDLIISDIMMPVMDGLELCRKVKNDISLSHIPIILLTARATDDHKLEGLRDGADDYITKPFNLHILKLRIEKILSWSMQRHVTFATKMDIKPNEITISSLDEQLIEKAIKAVENNMDNSDFSVEDLGVEVGMSRGHLYRKLMSITGKGPLEFIRVLRLKRACQYLKQSQMNVSEIAYITGFSSPKLFSKYFKEMFNVSPSEYKKEKE